MFRLAPRSARAIAIGTVAAVAVASVAVAAVTTIDRSAQVDTLARRSAAPVGDFAVVFDVGDVDQVVVQAALDAATLSGGQARAARTGALGLQRISRGGATVHAPPAGWLIPFAYTALPRAAVAAVYGRSVSGVLDHGTVVLNQLTADTTGARAGDVIEMQAADGSTVGLRIAAVKPYAEVGGTEMIMTIDTAVLLGATADTQVVVWGFTSRTAVDQAFAAVGLQGRKDTKINRSWAPRDPDDTLSTARVKAALGEPWYTFTGSESIAMHPDWIARTLTAGRVLLNSSIPVRAQCDRQVAAAISAALAEVAAAGLGGAIDVGNSNTYGGCYNPRFNRLSGQIGSLSRHAYAMALDMNTTSNCQGCVPRMNCDVVRIFRKHGFAWGGNFRRPDGMHFEWVGERRDQIPYASNYCPNLVQPMTQRSAAPESVGLDAMVVDTDLEP